MQFNHTKSQITHADILIIRMFEIKAEQAWTYIGSVIVKLSFDEYFEAIFCCNDDDSAILIGTM